MADKTRFFRVATEGATASDGREIKASWITEMAANYNRTTYGARVNLEHIRGVTGQAPFKAMGDVLALEARPVTIDLAGQQVTRLALYAQIDPTADLVALVKDRQKIYTSVEVAENFANTGKAGLVGLAVTDTPASLATEVLQFSATDAAAAKVLKADLDSRKTNPSNLFSAAEETTFDFSAAQAGADPFDSFLAKLSSKIFGSASSVALPEQTRESASQAQTKAPGGETVGGDFAAFKVELGGMFKDLGEGFAAARRADLEAMANLRTDFAAFVKKVEGEDAGGAKRAPAAGPAGFHTQADF